MLPIHIILHPTDFSPQSNYAFQLACALARDYNARLLVVHVYRLPLVSSVDLPVGLPLDPIMIEEGLSKQLLEMRPLVPEVQIENHLLFGVAADEIVRLARNAHCDLIVMGTHGRCGWGRVLLGSVAEAVLRKAPCPVVTVKAPVQEAVAEPVPETLESVHA